MAEERTYDQFLRLVQSFLKERNAIQAGAGVSGSEIIRAIKGKVELAHNSMYNYLSHAATHDAKSGIISEGPHRGYWFNQNALETTQKLEAQAQQEEHKAELKERLSRERSLYAVIAQWLSGKGYSASEVSETKSGGKWGNPDVAGVSVAQELGLTDIEIATVEVKVNFASWKTDIFEAISHKRFANRVYFCFPVTESTNKVDEEVLRYSELYRIGILHIELEDSEFRKLIDARSMAELDHLAIDPSQVQEKVPAPYDFIAPRYQLEFLKRIGIDSIRKLHTFGDEQIR